MLFYPNFILIFYTDYTKKLNRHALYKRTEVLLSNNMTMNKTNILPSVGFLFDLDGVLIDSEKEYTKIWLKVNEEYPTGIPSMEQLIKGTTLDNILATYYPQPDIQEKVKKRLYQLEGEMRYLYTPGARELLEALKTRNIPAALVTSSNDIKMRHLDDELPMLRSYFTFIVTADLITRSKPDPEGYLLGASKIGCRPENCVVFEDSLQGVKAGRASGAFVVGVAGTLAREAIAPYSDIVVDSLMEIDVDSLIDILKKR